MDKAHDALYKLKTLSESYDRLLDAAEANILLSIVEWATDKKKEAQKRLHDVLESLQQYAFIRIVANEGKAVLPILSSVIKKLEKETGQSDGLYSWRNLHQCICVPSAEPEKIKSLGIQGFLFYLNLSCPSLYP